MSRRALMVMNYQSEIGSRLRTARGRLPAADRSRSAPGCGPLEVVLPEDPSTGES
ncbi:hypothetical protein [Rhodococcus sp. 24CO]|uniref:hypothetical protein n=1 Tax=Rhodococcus sp. 24CO TaxID=3117460 RepID=UPI003D3279C4